MACSDGGAKLTVAFAELNGPGSLNMWAQHPSAFKKTYTLTALPATKITVNWTPAVEGREAEQEAARTGNVSNPRLQGQEDTATLGAVCAAAQRPNASIGEIGEAEVTWELSEPVRSLAALTRYAPTIMRPNEYRVAFEVLPNGTVPVFTEEVESMTREAGHAEAKRQAAATATVARRRARGPPVGGFERVHVQAEREGYPAGRHQSEPRKLVRDGARGLLGQGSPDPGTTLYPNENTGQFFTSKRVNVYNEPFNVRVNESTRLSAQGPYANQVHNVCAIDEAFGPTANGYAVPQTFTWRLKAPVRSLNELLQHPATESEIWTGE
jgi:hypothetical protein